jgi:GTP 3',8-cyclase
MTEVSPALAVNARCGSACFFCRPSGEAVATAAGSEVKVDDLVSVAKMVRPAGITSIKLTGGDPAPYEPLEEAVSRLRREAGFEEIEIISRHPRIGERAERLAALGTPQSTISLDTRDRRLHRELSDCPPATKDSPGVHHRRHLPRTRCR